MKPDLPAIQFFVGILAWMVLLHLQVMGQTSMEEFDRYDVTLMVVSNSSMYIEGRYDLSPGLYFFPDSTGSLNLEEIPSSDFVIGNINGNTLEENFRRNPNIKAYWIRFTVTSNLDKPEEWLTCFSYSPRVELYSFSFEDSIWTTKISGTQVPMSERYLGDHYGIIPFLPIEIPPNGQERTYFLRLETGAIKPDYKSLTDLDQTLVSPLYAIQHDKGINYLNLAIIGVVLGIGLYYLVFFVGVRDRLYLYFSIWNLATAFAIMHFKGHTLVFLLPEYPVWDMLLFERALPSLVLIPLIAFTRRYLQTSAFVPLWDKVLLGFAIASGIMAIGWVAVFSLFLDQYNVLYPVISTFFSLYGISFFLILIFIAFTVMQKGYIPAKIYFASTFIFILGIVLQLASGIDLISLPRVFMASDIGSALLSVLFALGLAGRLNLLNKEMLQAEQEKTRAEEKERKAQEKLNRELTELNTAFKRFVPQEFLRSLGSNSILDVQLGDGVEKIVTVMFSDIRSYTTFSEQMTPEENFHFLNGYLGRLGPAIKNHNGFVNQYLGDGIMAIFLESPLDAIYAGIAMHKALETYNRERISKNRQPIRIGIGMHTGPLMMGVIGDNLRMDAGVVSDTVNTAARMEGLTKFFGVSLLVSEKVVSSFSNDHSLKYRFLGKVQVKGRKEPLGVYDFYGGDDQDQIQKKNEIQEMFEEALERYFNRDFTHALSGFEASVRIYPEDRISAFYIEKCRQFISKGVPEDWNGVEVMAFK